VLHYNALDSHLTKTTVTRTYVSSFKALVNVYFNIKRC